MDLSGIGSVADLAKRIADAFLPDKAQTEKDSAAFKIQQLIADSDAFKAAAGIVQSEVGGTGIKAWWRPVTMLTFLALVVARFLGFDAHAMTPDDYAQLWVLIKIGLGGYVGGRSLEKIATTVAPALKK